MRGEGESSEAANGGLAGLRVEGLVTTNNTGENLRDIKHIREVSSVFLFVCLEPWERTAAQPPVHSAASQRGLRVTRLMQTSISSLTTQIGVLEGTAGLAKGAMFLSSSAILCVLFLCVKCLHANKVLAFSCCYLQVMSTRFKLIGGELNLGTPPLCFQTDAAENCNLHSLQGAILKG